MGNIKVETRWITRFALVLFGLVLACGCAAGPDPSPEGTSTATLTQRETVIYTADEDPCITVWGYKGGGGGGQDILNIPAGKALLNQLPGGKYAAYSPDGQTIVTMDSPDVYLWRADSYDRMHTLTGESSVFPSFSPDSILLATIIDKQTIRLWDVESGDPAEDFEISVDPDDTKPYGNNIGHVQFSPKGDLIAVGVGRTIAIVDATSGEVVRVLAGEIQRFDEGFGEIEVENGPASLVSQLVFDHSGKVLFSNEDEGTVHLWEVETGQYLRCITHDLYSKMALSPDGRIIAVAMFNQIQFYDPTNGEPLDTWRIPDDRDFESSIAGWYSSPHAINSIAYSRDGRTIMVSMYQSVRIYDALTIELIGLLRHPGFVSSVEVNEKSDRIITGIWGGEGLNEAWIWDANHADVSLAATVQNLLEDGVSMGLGGDIEGAKVVFKEAQERNPFPEHDLVLEGLERVTLAFVDQATESAVAGDSRQALELIAVALEVNPHPELGLRTEAIQHLVREICVQAGRDLTQEEYELYQPEDPLADTCWKD